MALNSKKLLIPVVILYAGMLLLTHRYNAASARALDGEVNKRLAATARAAAQIAAASSASGGLFEADNEAAVDVLSKIEESFEMENVAAADNMGWVANSTNPVAGGERASVELTPEERQSLSAAGAVLLRPLREINGTRFKTALARVESEGESGYLIMDLNLGYLTPIEAARKRLRYAEGLSALLFLIVFSAAGLLSRRLQAAVEAKNQQEKLAVAGRMAASIAHEIKNPLGIIKNTAALIQKKYGREGDEIFGFIDQEVGRLNRTLTDFLTYAKEIDVRPEPLDLDGWIRTAVAPMEGVQFEGGGVGSVKWDPDRLSQVLHNLILNAQKHGRGAVRVSTARKNGAAYLEVADQGPGFKDLNRLFEPFYTTSQTGTGLGLSICKTIVEKHGGKITAQNLSGGGALISVRLT